MPQNQKASSERNVKNAENIFNIPSNYSFLPTLVAWLMKQYPDQIQLAQITVLLPSRRACREIKKCFLAAAANQAIMLPKILAIGDVDYDQIIPFPILNPALNLKASLHKPVNIGAKGQSPQSSIASFKSGNGIAGFEATESDNQNHKINQHLQLISAIKNWNQSNGLFNKNLTVAALAEIADNLQSFIDEVEKEGLDLSDLNLVAEEELANHKQKILQFLQYFGGIWQNNLMKINDELFFEAKKRNLMLKNYQQLLKENGSKNPIIAAGSNGTVKETAMVLKTIASLENGKVVLFGLNQNIPEEVWQEISEIHPQFILKKLLSRMEVNRAEIKEITQENFRNSDSINNLSYLAMLPAQFCHFWQSQQLKMPNLQISEIASENEFEEARIIAQILTQTLLIPGKTAALISNDKTLISLVKSNLSYYQIKIDDSKNCNLAESKLANYLFLISNFAYQNAQNQFSAVALLAILKHPLTKFFYDKTSESQNNFHQNLTSLEIDFFRANKKFNNLEELILAVAGNDELSNLIKKISDIFIHLTAEFSKKQLSFKQVISQHFICLQNLAGVDSQSYNPELISETLGKIEGGAELEQFLQQITLSDIKFQLEPSSYNKLLRNLLAKQQLTKFGQFQPRLQILSTIEARLINQDLTIVSGLFEGQFPTQNTEDWLGGKIRADFGLPPATKKIGIFAYDFCNYLAGKEVILTYPKNYANSPVMKSRFLLKLATFFKAKDWQNCFQNPDKYLTTTSNLGQNSPLTEQKRSNPKPFLHQPNLLKKISATDISKWMRNPYQIYAQRILCLKPLRNIEQESSYAEFGNFVHKILEIFLQNYQQIDPQNRLEFLIGNQAQEIFSQYFPDKTSVLLWWKRFEAIAHWFLKLEEALRVNLKESFSEVEAKATINGVEISARVDRLNLYLDGSFEIVDYKTGSLAAAKEIKKGIEPQLAVLAVILSQGKITNYPKLNGKINLQNIKNLQYQNPKGEDKNLIKNFVKNNNISDNCGVKIETYQSIKLEELLQSAEIGLTELLDLFINKNFGFICCPDPDIYQQNKDDYHHLARIDEI